MEQFLDTEAPLNSYSYRSSGLNRRQQGLVKKLKYVKLGVNALQTAIPIATTAAMGYFYNTGVKKKRKMTRQYRTTSYGVKGGRIGPSRGGPSFMLSRPGELKGVDTICTQSNVTDSTSVNTNSVVLNLVQQGAGSFNRIGKKIFPKYVWIRGIAQFNYGVDALTPVNINNSMLRMVLVWDKQPAGSAIPTFETIFGTTDQAGVETSKPLDPKKYNAMDRFLVLRDKIYNVNNQNVVSGSGKIRQEIKIDEFVNLKGQQTIYKSNTSPMTISDINTGALILYFRTSNTDSSSYTWDVLDVTKARLRYTD